MSTTRFVLQILALICFLLAAFDVRTPRGNLIAGGLLFWLLSSMVGGV